ncbi:MAG: DUF5671 domain-containing protein [Candidatus Taylorbacteria bacterium]|nr:DUF5671 domain-containing protein [Candidatus Taylorbacteria bacterium]
MNPQTNNVSVTPKDFFLHLGAIVALYAGVVALINLSFESINYFFPDVLVPYFYSSSVAWPISMLIVLTPLFYVMEWYIVKDIKAAPEKAYIWIRRWGIFLTLFLAGVVIAGDLIALINTYLSGEIGIRFIWKAIAVFVIATTVFKYYFFTINTKYRIASFARIFHVWFGLALVIAAIVSGFVAVGSPSKQRAIKFDNQRVSDLQTLQRQIVSYWQQKNRLPASLSDLRDPISGFIVPSDPLNNTPYEYSVKGDKSFTLCSMFAFENKNMPYPKGVIDDNWDHSIGKTCFDRNIDPEIYPPVPKPLKL